MGHKDNEFMSPSGYSQKGCEWQINYTHFTKEMKRYSLFVFNYEDGLTAYEAWHKCNGHWPKNLTKQGICPAFHECTFDQMASYPYNPSKESTRKSGVTPLILVLDKEYNESET